jgi:hypothetical protein
MTPKQFSKGISAAAAKFMSSMKEARTPPAPVRYQVANEKVICAHCRSDTFVKGGLSSLSFDADGFSTSSRIDGLHILVCANCGHLEMFAREPAASAIQDE